MQSCKTMFCQGAVCHGLGLLTKEANVDTAQDKASSRYAFGNRQRALMYARRSWQLKRDSGWQQPNCCTCNFACRHGRRLNMVSVTLAQICLPTSLFPPERQIRPSAGNTSSPVVSAEGCGAPGLPRSSGCVSAQPAALCASVECEMKSSGATRPAPSGKRSGGLPARPENGICDAK